LENRAPPIFLIFSVGRRARKAIERDTSGSQSATFLAWVGVRIVFRVQKKKKKKKKSEISSNRVECARLILTSANNIVRLGAMASRAAAVPEPAPASGLPTQECAQLPFEPLPPAPERAHLTSIVDRAFSLFRKPENEWVRSFLNNDSQAATMQMISNPASLPYAVTSKLAASAFEDHLRGGTGSGGLCIGTGVGDLFDGTGAGDLFDGTGAGDLFDGTGAGGLLDSSVAVDQLHVPSFSTGTLTVGACVIRVQAGESADLSPLNLMHHMCNPSRNMVMYGVGRFVVNAHSSSEMLMVHHTTCGVTLVYWFSNELTTKRKNIRLNCDQVLFKQGRIIDSVRQSFVTSESRFCTICSAGPAARCGCVYPSFAPQHAFDFSSFCRTMEGHLGEFLGNSDALIVIPTPGPSAPVYIRSPLLCRVGIQGYGSHRQTCSEDVAEHNAISSMLINFATQLSISDASPMNLIMPTSVDDSITSTRSSLMVLSDDGSAGPLDFEDVVVGPHLVQQSPILEFDSEYQFAGQDDESGCGHSTDFTPASLVSRTENDFLLPEVNPLSFASESELTALLAIDPVAGLTGDVNIPAASLTDQELPSSSRSGQEPPTKDALKPAPKRYARLVGEEERAAREDERRRKNREAAAKSNARRKQLNDGLKARVKTSRERVAELQARQDLLREENKSLKTRLGQL
jgi:hypothetical protein